jgi:hypothetical protein
MRKHGRIKKCRPEDKKDGRKHPIEDQKYCLWDSKGDKILYAGPTRKAVEKQERAVQYYKHNAGIEVVESEQPVTIARISHPDIPEVSGLEIHGFDAKDVEYEVEQLTDHVLYSFILLNRVTPSERRRLEKEFQVDWKEVPLSGYGEYRAFFGHDPDIVREEWEQLADEGILYLEVEDYHIDGAYRKEEELDPLQKEMAKRLELSKHTRAPGMKKLWDEVSPLSKPPYRKPRASVILGGKVFRRALIQAAVPGAPNWKLRVALTEDEMESKLRPWLSKLVKFAHAIEDAQEQLLTRLPRKADLLKKLQSHYPNLVKNLDVGKLTTVADSYGDVGMELVEISNGLQEVFGQRSTYANYLRQIAPALDKLAEDDPTKALFLEAVASLHADEVVA